MGATVAARPSDDGLVPPVSSQRPGRAERRDHRPQYQAKSCQKRLHVLLRRNGNILIDALAADFSIAAKACEDGLILAVELVDKLVIPGIVQTFIAFEIGAGPSSDAGVIGQNLQTFHICRKTSRIFLKHGEGRGG